MVRALEFNLKVAGSIPAVYSGNTIHTLLKLSYLLFEAHLKKLHTLPVVQIQLILRDYGIVLPFSILGI